jgi:hypothetical protein
MKDADFDLRGKDWLTEAEAAHYCGVSLTQFAKHLRQFKARRFLGKKLYSRAELFDAIAMAEPWYPQAAQTIWRNTVSRDPKTTKIGQ